MAPFSAFHVKAELLSKVFRFTESKNYAEQRSKKKQALMHSEE